MAYLKTDSHMHVPPGAAARWRQARAGDLTEPLDPQADEEAWQFENQMVEFLLERMVGNERSTFAPRWTLQRELEKNYELERDEAALLVRLALKRLGNMGGDDIEDLRQFYRTRLEALICQAEAMQDTRTALAVLKEWAETTGLREADTGAALIDQLTAGFNASTQKLQDKQA